jgi:hypothetical protein
LKDVYPEFADRVDFYAITTDPTEGIEELERFKADQGYPWPVGRAGGRMLTDLRVLSQSTKVAFDGTGEIIYRDGYGKGNIEQWTEVLRTLAAQ